MADPQDGHCATDDEVQECDYVLTLGILSHVSLPNVFLETDGVSVLAEGNVADSESG